MLKGLSILLTHYFHIIYSLAFLALSFLYMCIKYLSLPLCYIFFTFRCFHFLFSFVVLYYFTLCCFTLANSCLRLRFFLLPRHTFRRSTCVFNFSFLLALRFCLVSPFASGKKHF